MALSNGDASTAHVLVDSEKRETIPAADYSCRRILTAKACAELVGMSRQHIHNLAAKGEFPPAIQLGGNRIGFLEAQVFLWLDARIAASGALDWTPRAVGDA